MSTPDGGQPSLIEQATQKIQQSAPPAREGQSDPGQTWGGGANERARGERRNLAEVHARPQTDIDLAGLAAQGFLVPGRERTRVADEFRIIKRPLLENAFGRGASVVDHGNLIMVTSALPGEGKTYTATNLAMSIAMEMDKTVLLIDADVGRATLHELLKVPLGPGLIDLLVDPSLDVGEVMLRTNIPKLRLISMGRFHPHASELLASDSMRRLVTELETRYHDRIVILDAPPVLATSDPMVLSSIVGQVVFVVAAGSTPQRVVTDALSLIDVEKPVGMVLNKVRKPSNSGYYGYGSYGYGYHGVPT